MKINNNQEILRLLTPNNINYRVIFINKIKKFAILFYFIDRYAIMKIIYFLRKEGTL